MRLIEGISVSHECVMSCVCVCAGGSWGGLENKASEKLCLGVMLQTENAVGC